MTALAFHQRKSRELFATEKPVVKVQSACFEKLIFLHAFNVRKTLRIAKFGGLEPRHCEDKGNCGTRNRPENFSGPKSQLSNFNLFVLKSWSFKHVFNVRKTKRVAKFDGLEPRCCEDIKGIVAPQIDPKSFGTFEKQPPGLTLLVLWVSCAALKAYRHCMFFLISQGSLWKVLGRTIKGTCC